LRSKISVGRGFQPRHKRAPKDAFPFGGIFAEPWAWRI